MNQDEHKRRHETLHHALDELLADYIATRGGRLSELTAIILIQWSFEQTQNPDPFPSEFSTHELP